MNNHKSIVSSVLIYLHAFLLASGNDTLSYVFFNITIFDVILVLYFLINIESISKTIRYNNILFIILVIFVSLSIYSTILNSVFENTRLSESISFLRYISYIFILITYTDFLVITKNYGEVFISFLLGVLFVALFDIYFISIIADYNFFENYGRYIFGGKYFASEYCFNNFFCYKAINVNNLSVYLSIGGALIITFLFNDKLDLISKKQKLFIFLLFIISFYISVGFGQKTAFFPFLGIILFSSIYFFINLNTQILKFVLITFIIFLIFIFFNSEILFQMYDTIQDRTFRPGAIESSWTTRAIFAFKAISLVDLDSSLIGMGKNSYFYLTGYNDPHNFNAQVFLETGIIGTLLYFSILYYIFYYSFQYSYFLGFLSIINYFILSNANGLAFQSHSAFIIFSILISLGVISRYKLDDKRDEVK